MDVAHVATLRDHRGGHQLGKLLVVAHRELQVAGLDCLHTCLVSCLTGQFKNLTSHVLEHCSHEDRATLADTITEASLSEESANAADGENQSDLGLVSDWLLAVLL